MVRCTDLRRWLVCTNLRNVLTNVCGRKSLRFSTTHEIRKVNDVQTLMDLESSSRMRGPQVESLVSLSWCIRQGTRGRVTGTQITFPPNRVMVSDSSARQTNEGLATECLWSSPRGVPISLFSICVPFESVTNYPYPYRHDR